MKITERKLRNIIQGVIRETRYGLSPESNYTYPGETGSEIDLQQLEQIYMNEVPIGGSYANMMSRIKGIYQSDMKLPCEPCNISNIIKTDDGATFTVRGGDGPEYQMMLSARHGLTGSNITADYSGTEDVRNHISSAINSPGSMVQMESVLRKAIRKEINKN